MQNTSSYRKFRDLFEESQRPYSVQIFALPVVLATYVLMLISELQGSQSPTRFALQLLLPVMALIGCVLGYFYPKIREMFPAVIVIVGTIALGEQAITEEEDFSSLYCLFLETS